MSSKRRASAAALLTAVCLLFTGLAPATAQPAGEPDAARAAVPDAPAAEILPLPEEPVVLEGHRLIARSPEYELYLQESSLSVLLRETATGNCMYSTVREPEGVNNEIWRTMMTSGVVLEYIKDTNVNPVQAGVLGENAQVSVELTGDGFDAAVWFADLQIGFTLQVRLTVDGFTAGIPRDSIREEGETCKVGGFYLYPFLGSVLRGGEPGYMLIPDGSGALIPLQDNNGRYKQPYSQMIFGDNAGIEEPLESTLFKETYEPYNPPQPILAPVFGMVYTDRQWGYLGVVEGGQYSARIVAYPNGAVTPYDWIAPQFIYRQVYQQATSKTAGLVAVRQEELNQFDARVRYLFVSGDQADYAGLAVKYRGYLLESGLVEQRDCAYHTRLNFWGADEEDGLLFRSLVPMTTAEDVQAIVGELRESGLSAPLVSYEGWQKGGAYHLPVDALQAEGALGGSGGIAELAAYLEKEGIPFFLAHDALRSNPATTFGSFDSISRFNKQLYEESVAKPVFTAFEYLTPAASGDNLLRLAQEYARRGISGMQLDGITNRLFSYRYQGSLTDRSTAAAQYLDALSRLPEGMHVGMNQPFSYLWGYADAITGLPLESSGFVFAAQDVPFLAIALKGVLPLYADYANFTSDPEDYFLDLVAQGVYPSYCLTHEDSSALIHTNSSHLYSSAYDDYREEILETDRRLREIAALVGEAVIEDYETEGECVRVTYGNGVRIYVNYGDAPATVDGVAIDAKGYRVMGHE